MSVSQSSSPYKWSPEAIIQYFLNNLPCRIVIQQPRFADLVLLWAEFAQVAPPRLHLRSYLVVCPDSALSYIAGVLPSGPPLLGHHLAGGRTLALLSDIQYAPQAATWADRVIEVGVLT